MLKNALYEYFCEKPNSFYKHNTEGFILFNLYCRSRYRVEIKLLAFLISLHISAHLKYVASGINN